MRTHKATLRWLRILARIWSLASIAFVLLMFIGEGLAGDGPAPTAGEWLGLALFPLGVVAGMAVAWRREGLGGAISVASFLLFYLWNWLGRGDLPRGPFFLLIAAPGFLFLACWWLSKPSARQNPRD